MCKSISLLCSVFLEQPSAVGPFSHVSCYIQETSEDTYLWLGLSPIDTGMPDGPLMLRNCFSILGVEHRCSRCTTGPGYAEDIDTIEMWLFDWLIESVCLKTYLAGYAMAFLYLTLKGYNIESMFREETAEATQASLYRAHKSHITIYC